MSTKMMKGIMKLYDNDDNNDSDHIDDYEYDNNENDNNNNLKFGDDMIQSYFDEAQDALSTSRQHGDASNRTRMELEMFLTETASKIDSEGNHLIVVPKNFEEVVDAMNRDDLISSEEKPWSKYLLNTNDIGFEKIFSERYNNLIEDTKETKLQLGLAEIHLLDKQLGLLKRKEAYLSTQDSEREKDTEDGSEIPFTNRSNVTTPRSVMSKRDATFLTRGNKTSTVGSRSEKSPSSPYSPASTNKTSIYSPSEPDLLIDQLESKDDYNNKSNNNDNKTKKKNFLQQNIERVGSKSLLTKEEQARLSQLLDDNSIENQSTDPLSRYGYDQELLEYEQKLDSELAVYGRLERLETSGLQATNSKTKNQQDYLSEQRAHREHQEYISKIDNMLETVTSGLMDLSEMVRPTTRSSGDDRDSVHSKLRLEVPSLDDVRVGKRISVDDVMSLVNMAVQRVGGDVDIILNPDHRREIDRLLGSLKNEIDRLASLRTKSQYYRGINSPFHKSIDSPHKASASNFNNQDLEYDENCDDAADDNTGKGYDEDEIIIEDSDNTSSSFLPPVPIFRQRPTSGGSKGGDQGLGLGLDIESCQLPEIMSNLTKQIASVKAAAAASKNKLFINRLQSRTIKEEIRKVLH